jgi:hypothetical protein
MIHVFSITHYPVKSLPSTYTSALEISGGKNVKVNIQATIMRLEFIIEMVVFFLI